RDRRGHVGRAIVHDDHLEIAERLLGQRRERRLQVRLLVAHGQENRDDRSHAPSLGLANGRQIPYGRDMPTIQQEREAAAERDYEAEDVLVVDRPDQLRALADALRATLIALLRERARSTQDIAQELQLPKGTVGHHLKVLERAGLIRVVRTRKVRALTEKFYGRVAWLFVIHSAEATETTGPL